MTSRIFVALAATWLIVSAFAWPHTSAQTWTTALAGGLFVLLSLLSMSYGWARKANLGVAVWLFLATLKMNGLDRATVWNNTIIAGAIFFATVIGGGPNEIRHEREFYGRI